MAEKADRRSFAETKADFDLENGVSVAFAAAGIPGNETKVSNRYYFVTEKGKEVDLKTEGR